MIGAIIGDVIGSVYENENVKTTDFPLFSRFSRFTDDTILTVAIADAILNRETASIKYFQKRNNRRMYALKLKEYGRRFPGAGYGQMFSDWLSSDSLNGYGSYGNGSAMRVSPIGYAFDALDEVLLEAKLSAEATHNHPAAVKGAQAIASAIFLARTGKDKSFIKSFIEQNFRYKLSALLDDIRTSYTFDSSCAGSVPQSIIAFLESENFEDAIRKSISIGGDSDTIACMTGGIAQAFYKEIPDFILGRVGIILDFGLQQIVSAFNTKYKGTRSA